MATKGFDTFRREVVTQIKQEGTCVYQKDSESKVVQYISNGVWALDLSILRLTPVELDYLITEATSVAVEKNGEFDVITRVMEPARTNNTTKAEDVGLRIHSGKRVLIPLLPEDGGRIVFLDEAKLKVFVMAAAMKKETVSFKVRTLDDTGERTLSPVLVCTSAEYLGVIMPVRLDRIDRRIRHTAKLLGEQLPA